MHPEPPLDRRLEPVRFLAGTATRLRILDALADGSVTRHDLDATLEAPRTTLRRNLADLEERHWVDYEPETDEYALTPAGRRARRGLRRAVDDADTASRAGTFLGQFPADLPVTAEDLDALTISVVTDRDPHGPVSWVQSHIETTDRLRGFVPSANPAYVASLLDFVADDFRVELVGSETVFEALRRDFADELAALRGADTVSLAVATDPPTYGIGLLDEYVFLIAYDDRLRSHSIARVPRADDPLGTWATDRYEAIVETAVPLAEWE